MCMVDCLFVLSGVMGIHSSGCNGLGWVVEFRGLSFCSKQKWKKRKKNRRAKKMPERDGCNGEGGFGIPEIQNVLGVHFT